LIPKVQPYDKKSKEYLSYTRTEPWLQITREIKEKAFDIVETESNHICRPKRYLTGSLPI
jgi:hypothetical protein